MKVMLAIAPWDMWESEDDALYPLGLAYLGAVLDKNNYQTDILSLTYSKWEDVKKDVEDKLRNFMPDILGISILSNSRVSAKKLINLAREINPKIKVIAGGVHTTCLYEQILNNYPVDFTVLDEGEITLLELLDAIKKNKPLSGFKKIKGIAFKNGDEIIKTEKRERIRDLDSLPFPKHQFFENIIKKYNIAYLMRSSRGCPFNCAFCPSSVHWERLMIQRSAKNVFEEIKYLLKKYPNLKHISFHDDEFVCNNRRLIDLCKMIIKERINGKIKWNYLGRVSSLNEEVIQWMKKAGCSEITFGVESGSQRILDNIGRKTITQQIFEAVSLCKKYGLKVRCLTIVGLPGENSQSVNETIDLFKRLKVAIEPAILIVFPGTEVSRLSKEKGLITDEYWLGEGLCPLYTAENSKAKLWWWSFKTELITHFYADNGDVFGLLKRKIFSKMTPHNFYRIMRRYVTNKT